MILTKYKLRQANKDKSVSYYTRAVVNAVCCEGMKDAWGEAVRFGDIDTSYGKQNGVNIYCCRPYPEGAVWDEYEINFCPFCAAVIVVADGGQVEYGDYSPIWRAAFEASGCEGS